MREPVIITLPEIYRNESEAIAALLDAGVGIVHLRKPSIGTDTLRAFCDTLSSFSDLTLHYDTSLAREYGFGGVHLPIGQSEKGMRNSYSCHSTAEIEIPEADYVFLSPVFDSVSKQGYRAAFDHDSLAKTLKSTSAKVVALGGITAGNITTARRLGFYGAAILGSLWVVSGNNINITETVKNYKKISAAWKQTNSGCNL